jgi:hypothetical protein
MTEPMLPPRRAQSKQAAKPSGPDRWPPASFQHCRRDQSIASAIRISMSTAIMPAPTV